jgi:hypothetical protein
MTTPSELIQRIAGTYIEDDTTPKPALLSWIQSECRHGCFRTILEEFSKRQAETLRPDLAIVEKAESEKITVRIPGQAIDHEKASPFVVEVTLEINPLTMDVKRVSI